MPVCKIKSKVVKSTINNKDILDMFQGIIGTGENVSLNLRIVYPKYLRVREHCSRFIKLVHAIKSSAVAQYFPNTITALEQYETSLNAQFSESFSAPDLVSLHPPTEMDKMSGKLANYDDITREEYDAFAKVYGNIKNCNIVNIILVVCKNLIPYKKYVGDAKELNDRFLTHSAGNILAPLPDCSALNFKQIYNHMALTQQDKQFVLMVVHKFYSISHDTYDAVSAPDIDVEEFIHIIVSNLDDVKKQIPRCDQAFDKILESVDLLRSNFNGYYKDFIASNNPTIIMENFVLDVSKNTQASPTITAQFRKIISHYRNIASQQAQNPKLRTLFQHVDKHFQELEKYQRGEAGTTHEETEPEGETPDDDETNGACDIEQIPDMISQLATMCKGQSLAEEFDSQDKQIEDE